MKKNILILAFLAIFLLAIPPVAAYTHYFHGSSSGIMFENTTITTESPWYICNINGLIASYNDTGHYQTLALGLSNQPCVGNDGDACHAGGVWSTSTGSGITSAFSTVSLQFPSGYSAHYAFESASCTPVTGPYVGRWWDYISDSQSYINLTLNYKSTITGLNIPRVNVEYHPDSSASLTGQTDLNGNVTFSLTGIYPTSKYVIGQKAGYNTTNTTFSVSKTPSEQYTSINLNDYVSPTGAPATVFVDIVDSRTGAGISGSTIGIENLTDTINPWYYYTEPNITAQFTTTGTYPSIRNLSVGQQVIFSGYKTGAYQANNTGTYTIPSAVSHTQLLLDPVSGNASSTFYYPVTVVDSATGNVITPSNLSVKLLTDTLWYNSSSATGKWNVTGTGPTGSNAINNGDQIVLVGSAPGYITTGYSLIASSLTNGQTQTIALTSTQYLPLAGEFTAVASTFDSSTSVAIPGVAVKINGTVKTTNSAGTAIFTNLSANQTWSFTATKTGYSTATSTFTGTSQKILALDIPMTVSSINPTATATIIPGQTTVVPTRAANGTFTGFWSPFYNGLSTMGADATTLNILMVVLFVFIGVVCGGFGNGLTFGGTTFSSGGAFIGGLFGFMLACAFGFINYVYVVVLAIVIIFIYLFFNRG